MVITNLSYHNPPLYDDVYVKSRELQKLVMTDFRANLRIVFLSYCFE